MPLELICEHEQASQRLTVVLDLTPPEEYATRGILGKIKFFPAEITLFAPADGNYVRQRFTLAHELGHYFLNHSRYMFSEYCQENDFTINDFAANASFLHKLEWQANRLASCLLLPFEPFVTDFLLLADHLGLKDKGFGVLYLDHQPCNKSKYNIVSAFLTSQYKVSRTVVKIRLEEFGLLTDGRNFVTPSSSRRSSLTKVNQTISNSDWLRQQK